MGELVSGDVFEARRPRPAFDPVFALRNHESFSILNVCQFDSEHDQTAYRDPIEETV